MAASVSSRTISGPAASLPSTVSRYRPVAVSFPPQAVSSRQTHSIPQSCVIFFFTGAPPYEMYSLPAV